MTIKCHIWCILPCFFFLSTSLCCSYRDVHDLRAQFLSMFRVQTNLMIADGRKKRVFNWPKSPGSLGLKLTTDKKTRQKVLKVYCPIIYTVRLRVVIMVSGRKRPLFGPSTRPLRRWKSDAEKTMSMWLKKRPPVRPLIRPGGTFRDIGDLSSLTLQIH